MHPYEMQQVIRSRHKDEVLVLKKGSLYHAIGRLERAGLITALETSRNGRRPERTTYEITHAGQQEMFRWLQELIATPVRETSQFMASLSFMVHLSPAAALAELEKRRRALHSEIESHEASMAKAVKFAVYRINLLETEYLLAIRKAELDWVTNLVMQLRTGEFRWDIESILQEVRKNRQAREVRA